MIVMVDIYECGCTVTIVTGDDVQPNRDRTCDRHTTQREDLRPWAFKDLLDRERNGERLGGNRESRRTLNDDRN
jgi:hypothetical protein